MGNSPESVESRPFQGRIRTRKSRIQALSESNLHLNPSKNFPLRGALPFGNLCWASAARGLALREPAARRGPLRGYRPGCLPSLPLSSTTDHSCPHPTLLYRPGCLPTRPLTSGTQLSASNSRSSRVPSPGLRPREISLERSDGSDVSSPNFFIVQGALPPREQRHPGRSDLVTDGLGRSRYQRHPGRLRPHAGDRRRDTLAGVSVLSDRAKAPWTVGEAP